MVSPRVPQVCFRVIFVGGNKSNFSLHEVSEGPLCLPLNVELQSVKKTTYLYLNFVRKTLQRFFYFQHQMLLSVYV